MKNSFEKGTPFRLAILAILIVFANNLVGCGSDPTTPNFDSKEGLWRWVNPLPTGNPILDIKTSSGGLFVGSGKAGTVVSLGNGNAQWVSHNTGVVEDFWTISISDDKTWFVGGQYGNVLKTCDSGNSWEVCLSKEESGGRINCIDFLEANGIGDGLGVAIVEGGDIHLTRDNGKTWDRIRDGDGVDFFEVSILENTGIYAVGEDGTAIKSGDWGMTWHGVESGVEGHLASVCFDSTGFGLCVGARGVILETNDFGESWTKRDEIVPNDLLSVELGESGAVVVGDNGVILVRDDLTSEWEQVDVSISNALLAVENAGEGKFLIGGGGVYELRANQGQLNAGIEYHEESLFDISYSPEFGGIAVGENGACYTNDGGGWKKSALSNAVDYYGCEVGFGSMIAVGQGGEVYFRDGVDRGFVRLESGVNVNLYDVEIVGLGNFIAVGELGLVLASGDGGESWGDVATGGFSESLSSISVGETGWGIAASFSGSILISEDNGSIWATQGVVTHDVLDIVAVGDSTAFAVGGGFKISKSIDRGLSWEVLYDESVGGGFYGVDFCSEQVGSCVGSGGRVFITTSGGEDWTPADRGTKLTLFGVIIDDEGVLTASGDNLTIIEADFSSLH